MAESMEADASVVANLDTKEGDENNPANLPDDVQYLADPSTTYTCFFLVGDPKLGPQEKIGGCRLHLMAHSEPMRGMLEGDLGEKGLKPIEMRDVQPEAFKHFLRFVNGYYKVSGLNMEESVNLMFLADKYIVGKLKKKLEDHMISILDINNVFLPLQERYCYDTSEKLRTAIDDIIMYETRDLFEKEDFLHLNDFGLENILKQEGLAVPEIDVWRAAVKWAKHNAHSEDGPQLRKVLLEHLKLIRVCALSAEDFARNVCPTNILSKDEVYFIIRAIGMKTVQGDLTSVCNKIEIRKLTHEITVSISPSCDGSFRSFPLQSSEIYIVTKNLPLSLTSVKCHCFIYSNIECTVKISEVKNVHELLLCQTITYAKNGAAEGNFIIGLRANLKPMKKYKVEFSFKSRNISFFYHEKNPTMFDSCVLKVSYGSYNEVFGCHAKELVIKTV